METKQQEELVDQFCAVTASGREQARFFLESCAWQLDSAVHSFFYSFFEADAASGPSPESVHGYDETGEDLAVPARVITSAQQPAAPTLPSSRGQDSGWGTRSAGPTQGKGSFGGSKSVKPSKDKGAARSNGGRGGITTLSDLNKHPESDSDSDGPQEYYTGGEKSGMMVQDPSKNQRDVDSIFDRARQFGAREGIVEAPQVPATRGYFSGTGRTVSGEPRQQEPGQAIVAGAAAPEPVFHTITFWRNGFTVDDGPLRKLDDPANASFLASINKNECPRELGPADRNTPIPVILVRKDEEWQAPPEPKYVAFQGTGRTLGSSSQPAPQVEPATDNSTSEPFQGLVVDEDKPATSIQLRLLDGTRMVARFNYHHTIADIRGFIDAARPGYSGPYQLQTMGFPPRQLSDRTETVQKAGLVNAVVIQKA